MPTLLTKIKYYKHHGINIGLLIFYTKLIHLTQKLKNFNETRDAKFDYIYIYIYENYRRIEKTHNSNHK